MVVIVTVSGSVSGLASFRWYRFSVFPILRFLVPLVFQFPVRFEGAPVRFPVAVWTPSNGFVVECIAVLDPLVYENCAQNALNNPCKHLCFLGAYLR